MGFAFTPSIVVLHHYFEKRFVVANGVAFAGISCGELVFPLILQPMLNAYGWRGALFLMAAVELNLVVCGGVMIRPRHPLFRETTTNTSSRPNLKRQQKTRNIQSLDLKSKTNDGKDPVKLVKDEVDSAMLDKIIEETEETRFNRLYWRRESNKSGISCTSSFSSLSSLSSFYEPRPRFLSEPRKSFALFMFGSPLDDIEERDRDWDLDVLSGQFGLRHQYSSDNMRQFGLRHQYSSDSLRRKDTIDDRQTGRPRGHSVLSHHSIIEPSFSVIDEFKHERFLMTRPLKNPFFVAMLPIMLLHGIGWYAVITHLIPFAVSFGIPDAKAYDLLSYIGFGSLLGCLTHGWFIDKNMVSSEFAKIGSLTLLTIITLVYPAAHYSYEAMLSLSFFYGIAAGFSLPLFFALIRQLLPPEDVNAGVSLVIIMEMLGDTIGGVSAGMFTSA